MHSTHNIEDDYLGSGKRLRYSINKYGRENHIREILEYCKNRKELKNRESEIVNLNELAKKDCMNLQPGGGGGFTKEQSTKGAKKRNELLWHSLLYEDWREKKIEEQRIRYKKLWQEGKMNSSRFTNKKHSKETKEKMRNADRTGIKNSQFGTSWITNDKESKKIHKNDLIPEGWRLGRKLR